ncbi:SDR family oxidoreductase [Duganella sp. FT80W]|uniref:SDR family oxidoreductase n=1 Tax=Duganella guangzhouensis TaxID=2666084 RepID=A0A6I2L8A3_9BURK|nr:SDR family oxidoreductase [Duganella guangzhouensis]MRW93990.1 SDR family oxidoreductase [Duganella guangzhouensis]
MAPLRVFITGASSGLGAALARQYASQGATLGLLARRGDALDALIAALPNAERHRAYAVDVRDHAAINDAAQAFLTHAGGVDVVIANAGISVGTLTEYAEDIDVFADVIATNVVATAATFAPFIAAMRTQRTPGRLVGVGSVAGIRGLPGAEAYSASKAAVISYCESLRLEMKPYGIRVVTLCPGYIDTPMTQVNPYPMPFLMAPDKFAARAAQVIAAGSSYAVIPWQMGVVAKVLRLLPNSVYDWAFGKAPHKPRKKAA